MSNSSSAAMQEKQEGSRVGLLDLVSTAVHDLRQPLRAIRASSELLESIYGDPANERTSQCLLNIQEGADRLELLIHDISEYCYEQLRELSVRDTNLEVVLAEARRQAAGALQRNQASITHNPLPTVTADFFALAKVFCNLIENACTFRGPEPLCIHVGATRKGSEWLLSVQDNGMGFKPEYAEVIFQPFQRLNGKQFPGSGLGLPVARRILQLHGGRVWAESIPGQGSIFWLSLPAGA